MKQDIEALAIIMHQSYEIYAKEEGWKTQKKCQVEFCKLPEDNKRVMLKVAKMVYRKILNDILCDINEATAKRGEHVSSVIDMIDKKILELQEGN